ncbi:MAG: AMP-binding protein, partial [Saccharospirillum sp.]
MDSKVYPVPAAARERALVTSEDYDRLYQQSIDDNEGFWREQGQRLDWFKPYIQVRDVSFDKNNLHIKWFHDGTLNVAHNCIDRHLATKGDQTAIIFEGDELTDEKTEITYRQLHGHVSRLANTLKDLGVSKGDRVTIYMPMIPEAAYAMLACARIGAIHSVVFGGFSPDALAGRIEDCDSNLVITADEGVRGAKAIPLKQNVDKALEHSGTECVNKVLVVRRTGAQVGWKEGRDVWYHETVDQASDDCPAEEMNAEDPLFILYTSGSTGKPKGVLHTTGGYLVYASLTHQYVFDYQDGDVYWCAADVGWITGHSYILYGPLANGAKTLMFEGVP